ncbi:unnamed protein product [Microthlaspi erraticum]|uniref:DUF538 domain-containing protein n=1 Tax=Microthlaspi erraticum TaxID=1685480 RepID=A0A6D2LD99_9BRAS|nr:unnamed protein product [Microthlaspi erraticum]
MALNRFLISIFFSLTLLTTTTLSLFEPDPDSIPTVYELLPKYGLPSGLLPDSVTNFTLSDDGRFVVHLAKPCTIEFDYLVYYEKTISGKIGYGSITDLKGIQVKRVFIWFDVDEIKVDLPPSDSIYFKVGFINKKLDIDQFKTVHSCGDNGVSAGSCGDSWKSFLQLQGMVDEAEMLITE